MSAESNAQLPDVLGLIGIKDEIAKLKKDGCFVYAPSLFSQFELKIQEAEKVNKEMAILLNQIQELLPKDMAEHKKLQKEKNNVVV